MRPRGASRWHHPALQPGWIDRPHQTLELGDLPLESGEVIRDFGISYVTHGARAPADDNVILVLTAIGWQTSAAPSAQGPQCCAYDRDC